MEQKTKKWLVAGALTIAVAIGVGTCYSNTSDKSGRENKEAVASKEDKNKPKEAKAAQKDKKSYYPLTIKTKGPDGKEYETVYEKQPEKVVAVYQGNVETMLALGLEDKIAAVAGIEQPILEEYQEAFGKLKNLEEFTPSKETITAEEPDMIFSWVSYFEESTLGDPQEWLDQNVNVYINTNTASEKDTLENEYQDVENIGKIFQVEEKANELVKSMKRDFRFNFGKGNRWVYQLRCGQSCGRYGKSDWRNSCKAGECSDDGRGSCRGKSGRTVYYLYAVFGR